MLSVSGVIEEALQAREVFGQSWKRPETMVQQRDVGKELRGRNVSRGRYVEDLDDAHTGVISILL